MEKRRLILDLLKIYKPIDDADRRQVERVVAFVKSTDLCFERSHLAGHITGSAWIVDPSGTRVLLTHHKKLGKWLQLGGHADGQPDVLAVALREAKEESGLEDLRPVSNEIFDVDVHTIPARPTEPEHLHYDIRFVFQAGEKEEVQVSGESLDVVWIALDELEQLTREPSMLRMREKWLHMSS